MDAPEARLTLIFELYFISDGNVSDRADFGTDAAFGTILTYHVTLSLFAVQ